MRGAILSVLALGGFLAFGPYTTEPEIPRWAFIYALGAVSLGALSLTRRLVLGRLDIALLALFAWAALSISWTSDWHGAVYALARAAALLAVYFGVRHGGEWMRPVVRNTVFIALVVVLALLAANPWLDGMQIRYGYLAAIIDKHFFAGFWLQNFVTEFILVAIPLLFVAGYRWPVAALAAVAYASTLFIEGILEWPVFCMAVIAGWVMLYRRSDDEERWILKCGALGVAVFGIIICVAAEPVVSSFQVRFEIWFNTLALIAQAPIFGHGLASYAGLYDGVQGLHLHYIPWIGLNVYKAGAFVGAAHNDLLQTWAELGIVGVGILGLAVYEVFKSASQRAAMWCLLSLAALAMVGFPWQEPAPALLGVIALGFMGRGQREAVSVVVWRWPVLVAPAAFCWAWIGLHAWQASYDMSLFRAWFPANKLMAAKYNIDAYNAFPLDHFIRRQLPGSVASLAATKGGVVMDNATADLLYRIGESAAPYSVEIRLARIQYLMNSGRWKEPEMPALLEDLKKRSNFRPEVWVADAYYSAFTDQYSRMVNAVQTAMKIDPGIESRLPMFAALVKAIQETPK